VCLHNQAYHLLQAGHPDLAGELMERCLPLYRDNSPYPLPAEWLHSAGLLALSRGDVDTADAHFREALERYATVTEAEGLPTIAVDMFDGLAVVAARRGQPVRALRLDAAADVVRRDRQLGREAGAEQQRAEALAAARAALAAGRAADPAADPAADSAADSAADPAVAERDGARLTAPEAVRYAIHDVLGDERPVLADRERHLVRLVAEGLTNRQIATRLRLTERAVEAALRDVRATIGARTRAQVAAWAAEHLGP
jgi:DNA-binding NarL/FixJ family response regulator